MSLNDYDPRLVTDLKIAERDMLQAYPDSLGNWTAGYGHLLPPAAPGQSWEGFTIIQSTADNWLEVDIRSAIKYAQALPEFSALDTDARQNAVVELCFNMRGNWTHFKECRAAIMVKDWQTAHDQLLDSLWSTQVNPDNFPNGRNYRIANYLLTGEYPT
jgi:GH24 family phage-related lysozyme (muramidase)